MHPEFARSLEMLRRTNEAAAGLAESLDAGCDPVAFGELSLDPDFTPDVAHALADGLSESARQWAIAISAMRRAEARLRSVGTQQD